MNARMLRTLGVTIGLVSLGEVLLVHWFGLASTGTGLSPVGGLFCLVAIGALNAVVFPWIRRRIRARGLVRVLSRTWILGSIGALFSGVLLASVFLLASLVGATFGDGSSPQPALVWLGGAVVALFSVPRISLPLLPVRINRCRSRCPTAV